MRSTFIETLTECARKDERIFLITADLGFSVLENFAREFPKRFLNAGIAEQNAVGVAAGLAMTGKIVYVYSIVPFVTMRCFEQVRNEVAYQQTRVRLVGVGGGLSYGPAGPTHHSIEDLALMRSLPGMTVFTPGDPIEARALTRASVNLPGPAYIRLGKNGEPRVHPETADIAMGKIATLNDGEDLSILVCGNLLDEGRKSVELLAKKKLRAALHSVHTLKPLDTVLIQTLINRGKPIFTLEEHTLYGGLGSAVSELIAESGHAIKFRRFAVPDEYSHTVGSQDLLRKQYGLDAQSLVARILKEV